MGHPRPRAVLVAAAILVASACTSGEPRASPSPEPPAPRVERPQFDPATFQHAIQARGKLRVGTSEDAPPFARREGATYIGFDADVARAIAVAIFGDAARSDPDRFITWVPTVPATRVTVLTDDKADIVVAILPISEEHQRALDLSQPYLRGGQRLMVKRSGSPIAGVEDLAERTVCALRGSPSEATLVAKAPSVRVLSLIDDLRSCVRALQDGAADAITADETDLLGLQAPGTRLVGLPLSDVRYAVGARKARAGFTAFLDATIAALVSDGRWTGLYAKHIGPLSGEAKERPDDKGRPAN